MGRKGVFHLAWWERERLQEGGYIQGSIATAPTTLNLVTYMTITRLRAIYLTTVGAIYLTSVMAIVLAIAIVLTIMCAVFRHTPWSSEHVYELPHVY